MKDILDFISSIMGSLAWPVSAIIIVILLKRSITELLSRLGKLKYGDLEAEFTKGMKEIKENIEESKKNQGTLITGTADVFVDYNKPISEEVEEIARVAPEAAIPFAWSRIEYTMNEKAKELESPILQSSNFPPQKIAAYFLQQDKISSSTFTIINTMRSLRNSVVHYNKYDNAITINDAIEYGKNAEIVINEIKAIKK